MIQISNPKNNSPNSALRILLALGILAGMSLALPATGEAVTSITPITWNIVGLDSNTPAFGPNRFPVGARVCSATGETNLPVTFTWDPATPNPFIDLRLGSANPIVIPSISPGGCADAYFEVEVQKTSAAFDTKRRYQISAGSLSTPAARELYVERLVSQSRNSIDGMTMSTSLAGLSTAPNIPNGGSIDLLVGNTYYIRMFSHTATQGYEQLESFVNFPNTIFQVLSVETTYSADTTANVTSPSNLLYGDACSWENDLNSPGYLACNGSGKIGGTMQTTYQVTVLSAGSGRETLNSLVYDFSGSSFHYNADYSTSARIANLIDPATVSIAKSFFPKTTNTGGTSTLTFTLSNPNGGAVSGVNFTDTFPTSPGAMVVASSTGASTNGCGTPTFSPLAGAGSISFSNGTIPAYGSCTVKVNVTAPATGFYANTTSNLFVGTVNTGSSGSDTLEANTTTYPTPSPPAACNSPVPLATWNNWTNFAAGASFNADSRDSNVLSATATFSTGGTNARSTIEGTDITPDPFDSWYGRGWSDGAYTPTASTTPYFQFNLDTTNYGGVRIAFDYALLASGDWAAGNNNHIYAYSSANGGAYSGNLTTGTATKGSWQTGANRMAVNAQATGTSSTAFRINADTRNSNKPLAEVYLDNVVVSGCARIKPPEITKTFSTNPVAVGGTSTLTFTLTNPNADTHANYAYTGLTFTDAFPGGLTVASPLTTTNSCGGAPLQNSAGGALAAGDTGIKLPGGSLASGGTCTVSVLVKVDNNSPGPHENVSGFVSATQGGANTTPTGSATAALVAVLPPSIEKLFAPNPILAGGTSTLTFTLANPNPNNTLSGVAFTDTLPGGLTVTTGSSAVCGGTLTRTAPSTIAFSGGSLAAGGSCSASIQVSSPSAGDYLSTSAPISHTLNGTWSGNTASDTLRVNTAAPGIALVKEVGPSPTGPWTSFLATTPGTTLYYHYTVENYGDVPLTSVSVSDADPLASTGGCSWGNLPVAVAANDNHIVECTSGPFSALSGSWQYTATASGTAGVTVSDTSRARYATAALSLVKNAVQNHFKTVGQVLDYTFVVTNDGFAPLVGPITIADDKASDESCPALGSVGDLDNYLDPGESITCTASYTVTAADVSAKQITNIASASAGGFTSPTGTKILPLAADLSVVKTNDVGGTTTVGVPFAWTLTVTNSAASGSSAAFADGQVLLKDELPDTGASYSVPATAGTSAGTTGTIACAIASSTLTCTAGGGAVTIPPGESFSIAVAVTPTAATTLVNPKSGGVCEVDPDTLIGEMSEADNSCSDSVTVNPASATASLLVVKSVQPFSDPINGTTSPKAIPGAFVTYTILVTNTGLGAADPDSTVITDGIPADTELFVGDIGASGSGPVLFSDGATPSGLTFTFVGLDDAGDGLSFSDDGGATYAKNDTAEDANQCDPTVTHLKISLGGTFAASDGTNHPSFSVKFRVRVQ